MNFYVKIHQNGKEKLAAICDEEIHGNTYLHNGVNIVIRKEFYGKEIFNHAELLVELMNCTSINAFGKNICQLLIENKIVHPASVLWIESNNDKIGHVIVVK